MMSRSNSRVMIDHIKLAVAIIKVTKENNLMAII